MSDLGVLPAPTFVDVAGVRTRYRETGATASGPAILLIHGIGRSLDDWDDQHRLLGDDRHVVSLDLAGFGDSSPLRGRHTLEGLASFVDDFVVALDLGRVDVVGNSLGGAVAMALSVRAPSRVRRLVLLDSAGFGATVTAALRLIALPVVGRILLRPTPKTTARTERALFVSRDFVSQERISRSLARGSRPQAMRAFREVAHDLGTARGIRPAWRSRLLAAVDRAGTPVLVVWGARDIVLPASHLDSVAASLPSARTHLFDATGHMPQIERAAETAQLIRQFFDE
ncbi:putative hydrolase [Frondihabitans sucicola]|uniref:Hydrolase n=1 Tax=Frondihabitans sucicola TaxID=1268041 RepID=A0ABM8GKJ2_9MICO|nr:alpha/beta fold hydrolase [Frondihabitans sucicola]BDZ48908.1 putative hydrolase [Frondihabitans sucicola]